MDNTRVEQLVQRKVDTATMIMRVLAVGAAVVLSLFSLWAMSYFGLVFVFAIVYCAMFLFKMTMVEYEYLLVNNELSIDIIYNKEKRKHCCSFNVKEAEIFAPIESDRVHNYLHNEKIIGKNYTSGEEGMRVYVLVVNSEQTMVKLFIEPNEKLFEGIKSYIPRKTYTE